MRTALFVYQTTTVHISTIESDLELAGMIGDPVRLCAGENELTIDSGIYKIDSSHDLEITGNVSMLDIVSARKNNDPAVVAPNRAAARLAMPDMEALQAFMSAPDAKQAVNP